MNMDALKDYDLNLPQQKKIVTDGRIENRFIGFIIDIFLIYIVILSPLTRLLPSTSVDMASMGSFISSLPVGLLTIFSATVGLVFVLYFSLFEYHLGFTPGMRIVGLRTHVFTFPQAVVRNLFLVPLFPFSLLFVLELYYLFRYKQRFLEKASETRTIEIMTYD